MLLDALRELPNSINVCLHVVTTTEGIGQKRDNIVVRRDVTPNSEKLMRLFSEADVFILPTHSDCLPLAVMEALASGLPVITTNVGALPETVAHGETGWIIPRNDPLALADAITTLITDSALRQSQSKAAREAALARFDAATNYKRLLHTMTSVASERGTAGHA